MNPQDFIDRTIMPSPIPQEEEAITEPEEHPNQPMLENLVMTIDAKSSETNQLLEQILIKMEDKDSSVGEHGLIKQGEAVDVLNEVKEQLIKLNEPWDIKLILE